MIPIRIDHRDRPDDVIRKVNAALQPRGLHLSDDGLPHDGYCEFTLAESMEFTGVTFGRVPPEEERDTIIFGTRGEFWGRVVGSPDQSATERLRLLQQSSPNVPAWSSDFPRETGWYKWRPTSDQGSPTQCVWVVGIERDGVSCWMIAVSEPLILRCGEWCGPLEMK